MKILFISSSFYPNIGGVEKHLLELSRVLIAEGHTVTVLTPKTEGLQSEETVEKIIVKRFQKNKNKLSTWKNIWKYSEDIAQADIIHAHDYIPFYWIYPLAKMKRKKVWVTFHGWEGKVPPAWSTVCLRRIAEKFAAGSIAIGQFIQTWYHQHPNKILYGGVHCDPRYPLSKPPLPLKKFAFLGRLDKDTGFDVFADFFIEYALQHPQATLTVIGDGPLRTVVKQILQNAHVTFSFAGKIPDPVQTLQTTDAVCCSGYLSILEIMALGIVPMALYSNALRRDYLHLTPFSQTLVTASSSTELLEKVKNLTTELMTELLKINFNLAKKNSWEYVADEYHSLWLGNNA